MTVALDGRAIDDLVLAEEVEVRVGRRGVLDEGEPGSASLTLYLGEWLDVSVGARVVISDNGVVRFDGVVTDSPAARWEEHPADPEGWMLVLRVMCAGPLARWGRDRVGDEPWPAETVAERAARIAALVGAQLTVQGGGGLRVVGRDVDSQPASLLLDELATDCAGWLYDHQGTTYLQSLDIRRQGDPQETWDDQTTTWDAWDGTWDEQTETSPTWQQPVPLPPGAVLFAPSWQQNSTFANDVRVFYGPLDEQGGQASVQASDQQSIERFGRSAVQVRTRLESSAEAQLRAALTIERAAWPRWHLPSVQVAWELLDGPTATVLDAMLPGVRCQVTAMPQPGPAQTFDGCVEGWVERWAYDEAADDVLRTTTLHLSDVRWSFAVLTWDGIVPDDLPWDGIDATWDELITADDLQEA